MLPHPITHQLRALKLDGMAQAIQEQQEQPQARELSFEERLTLLELLAIGRVIQMEFFLRLNIFRLKEF